MVIRRELAHKGAIVPEKPIARESLSRLRQRLGSSEAVECQSIAGGSIFQSRNEPEARE
jgi:hypothetical protein